MNEVTNVIQQTEKSTVDQKLEKLRKVSYILSCVSVFYKNIKKTYTKSHQE